MSAGSKKPRPAPAPGELYVYRDEDRDAVAIAKACTGPNGGFVGADICRIAIPRKYTTQAELNAFALLFTAAPELLAGAKLALDLAEGLIRSDYENTAAYHPMMAELEPVRAAIAKAEGRSDA